MSDLDVRQVVMDVLSNPMDLPSTFWDYATQSWLKDAPVFPISQVFGFTQFTAQPGNYIDTQETLSVNAAYTALATDGPAVTGLPSGHYAFWYGGVGTGGNNNYMGININGVDPVDADACYFAVPGGGTVGSNRATLGTLSAATNTVICRYKTDAQPATFRKRWLIALKYGNI